jgi:hypothetical protein
MIQAIVEMEDLKCVVLGQCILTRNNGVVPIAMQRASEHEGREGQMQKVGRLRREQGIVHVVMLMKLQ